MNAYLSCGNIMSDIVVQPDGYTSGRHMGGPAFFALAGMRLWTADCTLVTGTGADYEGDYGHWLDLHGISRQAVRVAAEHVTCYQIAYDAHGRSLPDKSFSYYGDECMGYLKTHPRHIEQAVTPDVCGIYMAQGADRVVWRKLKALKDKYGFKLMWELEYFNSGKDLERVLEALPFADAWSLNSHEAAGLFGLDKEDDARAIERLQALPVPFTFYRVGRRGAYAVTPQAAYFCPAVDVGAYVDQTGCGNSSTGAAMYALFSGHSPQEVVVMANIASGFNCLQYGPYPHYTPKDLETAKLLLHKHIHDVTGI